MMEGIAGLLWRGQMPSLNRKTDTWQDIAIPLIIIFFSHLLRKESIENWIQTGIDKCQKSYRCLYVIVMIYFSKQYHRDRFH